MLTFTILGASGFVGRDLAQSLQAQGHIVHPVTRSALPALLQSRRSAGHVIDCIGLTADFRARPHDTAEAHVGITARCLAGLRCESFLFLSSTRVYARAAETHEDAVVPVLPHDPSDIYNLTKLAGEALCLADPRATVRVARLSNVYGPGMGADTFVGQLLEEGAATGAVLFCQSPQSAKDYIALAELQRLLPAIAIGGRRRLYNVASGRNTSHADIAAGLTRHFSWRCGFAPDAPTVAFASIATTRLTDEFGPVLSNFSEDIGTLRSNATENACSPLMRQVAA